MQCCRGGIVFFAVLLLATGAMHSWGTPTGSRPTLQSAIIDESRSVEAAGRVPLKSPAILSQQFAAFAENVGQVNGGLRYYVTLGDINVGFVDSAVLVEIIQGSSGGLFADPVRDQMPTLHAGLSAGVVLQISSRGSATTSPQGRGELPFRSNYLIGRDPGLWRIGVRSYREIIYPGLYAGVDLVYQIAD